MNEEDAQRFIIDCLRNLAPRQLQNYGYDVYLPNIIWAWLVRNEGVVDRTDAAVRRQVELSTIFYTAAWELCRRGVLRPGITRMGEQATPDGASGNGYSITPFGRTWIAEADNADFIPTEPQRFAAMLEPFRPRFGAGFQSRAQEAVRCYGAHAYLACVAMCGAAAESILLAAAIATRPEEEVLGEYASARGRSRVERRLLGQASEQMRGEFQALNPLLKYWRDQAAHGTAVRISESEAFTALGMLLRFAYFVDQRWAELTEA